MRVKLTNSLVITTNQSALRDVYETFLDRLPVRDPRKVLFVNIPQVPAHIFNPETARAKGYHNYPPVGYLYLAAAARLAKPDIELSVLDLNHEMLRMCHIQDPDDTMVQDFWKELISEELNRSDQVHVCVGNMFEATTPMLLEITEFIREHFKNVTLITGGVQTTLDYKRLLESDCCHIAFRHEAEPQFRAFLESCSGTKPLSVPHDIAFKLDDRIYETPPSLQPQTEFLDITPYFSLIEVENYHKYGGVNPYSRYVGNEKPYGTVLSNRGCRAQCTFCSVQNFNGLSVRRRSAESVVDEIKYLVQEKGIRVIEWLDDDLLFGRKGSEELFRLMAKELPEDFEWIANNGLIAGAVTEEIMYWMVKSGCKAFKVGIESGNEAMLRKIKKPATKENLRKAGRMFNKYPEVFVSGNYIVGFPEETFDQMMDSYNFSNELSWDWANYYICQPLPGTDVYDAFQSLGDDRCNKDYYVAYNPGKSDPQKGDFGYHQGYHSENQEPTPILSGRDVFQLPKDLIPSQEQIKEIWFTFNIVTNFFNNRNLRPGGNPEKLVRWFESIAASYPRDASMCALLSHGHGILGNHDKSESYREKFYRLVDEYDYWKRRVQEFPELLEYAGGKAKVTGG
jgi:radical SAM superfamily enzyme YgiQ (UPF0313 family)